MLFLVIGNSGSGKDSIISGIIKKFPANLNKIYSPKRYITRTGSITENNIEVTKEKYNQMCKKKQFALSWYIYEYYYGIPIIIDDYLKKGIPVIINVSRNIVEEAKNIYKNIKIMFINVPIKIIINRLKERDRENREELKKRIIRAQKNQTFQMADITIDNSGDLEDAVNQSLNFILSVIK